MININKIPIINGYRYIITNHVKEKMRERFGSKIDPCDWKAGNAEIYSLLEKASENKSIFNNTQFIANVYNRYGADSRIKFMQVDSIIFIAIAHKDFKNCFVVVTCYDANTSSKPHFKPKRRRF